MKDKINEKLIIRILLSLTVFFAVFIVVFQIYEKNVVSIPEKLVYVNSSQVSLPESFKEKMEGGIYVININTATKEEFEELPGIGETIAESIIAYREENGNFERIEDIMEVKRIGEKTFERIKMYLTL